MVRHSILIPHRDRNRNLGLCLWSLLRSARHLDRCDWEVVVVDSGSKTVPQDGECWRVVTDLDPPADFNKSRCLNVGIESARGCVLTILDADAIVGKRFLESADCLDDPSILRCCYRVRYLPPTEDIRIETAEDRAAYVDELFGSYDDYRRGLEAYGTHDRNVPEPVSGTVQPWGNSQFSIRRDALGDLRYDEQIGWGLEDQDMNLRLQALFGPFYRATIFTDSDHAMFHVEGPEQPWRDKRTFVPNYLRYRARRKMLQGQ